MEEVVPAYIDIQKVEVSIDGLALDSVDKVWTVITTETEDATVYIKKGTVPDYRVTVKNTGGVDFAVADYTWGASIVLKHHTDTTVLSEGDISLTDIAAGASETYTFSQTTGVVRGDTYKISTYADKTHDTFSFTIAEPAFIDITGLQYHNPEIFDPASGEPIEIFPPFEEDLPIMVRVNMKNIGDYPPIGVHWIGSWVYIRYKVHGGSWIPWIKASSITPFHAGSTNDWLFYGDTSLFSMPNHSIDIEARTAKIEDPTDYWDEYATTIYESIEGIFTGTITVDGTEVAREGTIKKQPTSKTVVGTIKNTSGETKKLTITLVEIDPVTDEETIIAGPTETATAVAPDATLEVEATFSYPGGDKKYGFRVDP